MIRLKGCMTSIYSLFFFFLLVHAFHVFAGSISQSLLYINLKYVKSIDFTYIPIKAALYTDNKVLIFYSLKNEVTVFYIKNFFQFKVRFLMQKYILLHS